MFMFSKKATIIDEIFTVDLTLTTKCQIDGEDFDDFCGLLRKQELYDNKLSVVKKFDGLLKKENAGIDSFHNQH